MNPLLEKIVMNSTIGFSFPLICKMIGTNFENKIKKANTHTPAPNITRISSDVQFASFKELSIFKGSAKFKTIDDSFLLLTESIKPALFEMYPMINTENRIIICVNTYSILIL